MYSAVRLHAFHGKDLPAEVALYTTSMALVSGAVCSMLKKGMDPRMGK